MALGVYCSKEEFKSCENNGEIIKIQLGFLLLRLNKDGKKSIIIYISVMLVLVVLSSERGIKLDRRSSLSHETIRRFSRH